LTEKYKDREVCILKIKEGNTLIRIAYVVVENKIIILDAIDKPSSYQKGQKKKIDKMIQDFLDRVESYLPSILSLPLNLPDWKI
jgi:hypothetical protein